MRKIAGIILFFAGYTLGSVKPLKQELYSYTLKMQLPHHIKFNNSIPVFYKGSFLELGNHCTLIAEDTKVATFSLIITPEASFEAKGNNVNFRRRLSDQPFCWYDLTLHYNSVDEDEKKRSYTWSIKKLSSEEAPLQIPDHAIIIYNNPKFIERLEDFTKEESLQGKHIIALPTIVVQSDIDQEQFDKACDEAWLAALELRTIHQKAAFETKQEPQSIISLCKHNH